MTIAGRGLKVSVFSTDRISLTHDLDLDLWVKVKIVGKANTLCPKKCPLG